MTAAIAFLLSVGVAYVGYPSFIRLLQRIKAGQVIQAELPAAHQAKAGTPTGGGLLFVGIGLAGAMIALATGRSTAFTVLVALAIGGGIGLADDLSKLRRGAIGIPARLKVPVQVLFAVPLAAIALGQGGTHQLLLGSLPWLVWPLAVIAIVGSANAVNITDGIDGLAGGLSVIALAGLALLLPHAGGGEVIAAMALTGAIAAFLAFNRHPARVFMGDTGALAIGFAIAAMAIQQGLVVLLPLLALVFVLETLSVIIQVAYFKASGGRRVFKMTPIHYTFRHEGWSENRIALTFWGAGLLSALAAAGVARLVT
jgi:phospho-N-acetylmuramoyl-pentapeptide-transferase